jgi:hypothetical protein
MNEIEMTAAAKVVPKQCPKCGADPIVNNPRPRYYNVTCSKNGVTIGGHRVIGHAMFTKKDAIAKWNKLASA